MLPSPPPRSGRTPRPIAAPRAPRPQHLLLLALLLGAPAAPGCSPPEAESLAAADDAGAKDAAGSKPPESKTLVRVAGLQRGRIEETLEVSTDISAEHVIDLYSRVGPAYVREVLLDEGDLVKKGEPLMLLDAVDFELEVRRRKSQLAQRQQEHVLQKTLLAEAEARVRAQAAQYEKAKADWERATAAMAGSIDVLSERELTDYEAAYLQAKAEADAVGFGVERARADLDLAELLVEAARIELESAQRDLEDTSVRSPIDGVVSRRDVNAGLLVNTTTHLYTVIDPARLISNLRIPQEEVARLTGERIPVEFHLDALPGEVVMGHVEAVVPAVDPSSGLVKVRVRLDPSAVGRVLPGMYARARVVIESREDALLLSKRAVVYDQGESYVFVVRDGLARRVPFEPGASTASDVEVLAVDGAAPDAALRVIVVGQDRLRDGDPVTVVGESA